MSPVAPGDTVTFVYDDGCEFAFKIPTWGQYNEERPSACRSCGATILWVVTKKGRRAPINADGTSHFATCPQADSWRRRK